LPANSDAKRKSPNRETPAKAPSLIWNLVAAHASTQIVDNFNKLLVSFDTGILDYFAQTG
jgi:hypothetical protein